MNNFYNSRQRKIYEDYAGCSTDSLVEMVKSENYLDEVTNVVKDILTSRNVMIEEPKKEITKDGWSFGGLPTITYDSDLGFQYGAMVNLYDYGDGSGYPKGLKGDEIPLGAKIIAVADFFEAITAKRHYRDPIPRNEAIMLLMKEGENHFDQTIIDAFLKYYNKTYPSEVDIYYGPIDEERHSIVCNQ